MAEVVLDDLGRFMHHCEDKERRRREGMIGACMEERYRDKEESRGEKSRGGTGERGARQRKGGCNGRVWRGGHKGTVLRGWRLHVRLGFR